MRVLLLLTLAVAATAFAAPEDFSKPKMVSLKSGKRVIGRIVQAECSDIILVIREIRSGAKREIKWTDIRKDQAHSLRVALGFEVEEAAGGKKLKGHRIVTKSGAEFVGLLINAKTAQRDGMYILKRSDGERRIRIDDVREGPDEVDIDALEVYTPMELYEAKLKQKTPETAQDHFQLAEFAATMGALDPAKMHYEKVLELADPKYPEALIKRRLERIAKRIANKDAEDALREIRKLTWRKSFVKASVAVTKFKEKYVADVDLMKAVEKLDADLKERRQDHFTTQVPKLVRGAVQDLLGKKVKEAELTLRLATNYAGGESSDDTSATHEALIVVSEKLGIEPEEVLEFWKLRNRRVIYKAFYRDGTFIVVDNLQDALAKAPKPPAGKGKNQPKPPKPHPIKTPDGWWSGKLKARKYTQARDFLYAWWAEKSNMVEVLDPKKEACRSCSGRGYTAGTHHTAAGAIAFFDRCQTCHMAKEFRVVRFK